MEARGPGANTEGQHQQQQQPPPPSFPSNAPRRSFSLPRPALFASLLGRRTSTSNVAQTTPQTATTTTQSQSTATTTQTTTTQQHQSSYDSIANDDSAFSNKLNHSQNNHHHPHQPPQMLRVASQKMSSAVDKAISSFSRSFSLLASTRSSIGSLLASTSSSTASLTGPDLSFNLKIHSDFDYLRSETPLSPEKIQFRLSHIEQKLAIEKKVLTGTERMFQVMSTTTNTSSTTSSSLHDDSSPQTFSSTTTDKRAKQVHEKLKECTEKCTALVHALKKYRALVVDSKELPPVPVEDLEDMVSELLDDPFPDGLDAIVNHSRRGSDQTGTGASGPVKELESPTTRAATLALGLGSGRNQVSGRLKVTLVGCSNLVPLTPPTATAIQPRPETYAILRIDSTERIKTRSSRSKWMDTHEIPLDRAIEVEIAIHEKGTNALIAFVWFSVSDLDVMIKRARERKLSGVVVGRSDSFTAGGEVQAGVVRVNGASEAVVSPPVYDGENLWLDLEPAGQLSLKLNFTHDVDRPKKATQDPQTNLLRSKPVPKILTKRGHKFLPQKFYPIMKCAVCAEFLTSAQGYQCQSCKYLCHKKCQPRVPIKCITLASGADDEPDEIAHLYHRIPHRWTDDTVGVSWCAHCGQLLPVTKRGCKKCGECGVSAHSNCSLLVPDACGMTAAMREQMRGAVEMVEKVKREREVVEREKREAALVEAARKREEEVSAAAAAASAAAALAAGKGVGSPLSLSVADVRVSAGSGKGATPPVKKGRGKNVGLDDFTFLAVLGKGNFGKVMLAEEKATGNYYAIKVLKKEFIIESDEVEATRSEKRVFMTANLERFPFMVNLHSCFQTESRLYFVMEYVSGGDLMWHIQQQHFSEARAKFYACEVLLALEYFHKNDIIYRDLKLDNILLTLDGHIKIADYGLCKEGMPFGSKTTTFCGTPEFMSPEILMEKPYTRSVDWWSYGVLIYELLLGQAPFKGENEDEIFNSILYKDPLFPANMDRDAMDLILKLLTKKPEERLGSTVEDADEIKRHPWFRDVVWQDMLERKLDPPFVPAITSATDVSNFDEEFTKEMPVLTPVKGTLAAADQEEFRGFTHVSEWAQKERAAGMKAKEAGSVHR